MKLWQFLSVILILSISPLEISGQNNSGIVSGSVFNSGQEPLVGVSVFVKGTNIGTMTDADGRFSVKAEDGQSLEFRYIGYDTKVVTVNGKTMSVTMSETVARSSPEAAARFMTPETELSTSSVDQPAIAMYSIA